MDQKAITKLWKEHYEAPFPASYRGKDVGGVDCVMLDADVAGCVDTFLSSGNLNLFQTAVLGLRYRELGDVIPLMNSDGKAYYSRLERLAELVLTGVVERNKLDHGSEY